MYVDATTNVGYEWAELYSPALHNSAASCEMRFWYHMNGQDIGELEVYLVEQYYVLLPFLISGDQGDRWNEGVAPLGRIKDAFYVSFNCFN